MKIARFPAARIVRQAPVAAAPKRRRRNIIETMVGTLAPAVRLFPDVHGAGYGELELIHPRIAEQQAEQFRQAQKEANHIASLFGYCAHCLDIAQKRKVQS
jgi:hypothetical protein